jgi:hypothetical protein
LQSALCLSWLLPLGSATAAALSIGGCVKGVLPKSEKRERNGVSRGRETKNPAILAVSTLLHPGRVLSGVWATRPQDASVLAPTPPVDFYLL